MMVGSPSQPGPTFLHINTFTLAPSRVTSVKAIQSDMRERWFRQSEHTERCVGLNWAKGLPLGLLSLSGETAHLPLPFANINTYLSLRAKCWLRKGVGGQLPRNPLLISFGSAGRGGGPFTRGRCFPHKQASAFLAIVSFSCFSICSDCMNLAEFLLSFLSFDFRHLCEMNILKRTPCSSYV